MTKKKEPWVCDWFERGESLREMQDRLLKRADEHEAKALDELLARIKAQEVRQ